MMRMLSRYCYFCCPVTPPVYYYFWSEDILVARVKVATGRHGMRPGWDRGNRHSLRLRRSIALQP
jgi:hypothetical protein